MYAEIYVDLCMRGKNIGKQSGMHSHHIQPKHMGGSDELSNITQLTVREHIIAHFLLWKIYKNPNDLRAMKMLGAKLSTSQRREIGIMCRDQKIGFFGATEEEKFEWRSRARKTQMKLKIGIHNPDMKSEWCSMGGLKRGSAEFNYWASAEGRSKRASMGGKSHTGKISMYIPGDTTFIRVVPDQIEEKLKMGYVKGSPLKTNLGKKFGPSVRRKSVTDGNKVFSSMAEAAREYSVSVSSIIHWCKSGKNGFSYT